MCWIHSCKKIFKNTLLCSTIQWKSNLIAVAKLCGFFQINFSHFLSSEISLIPLPGFCWLASFGCDFCFLIKIVSYLMVLSLPPSIFSDPQLYNSWSLQQRLLSHSSQIFFSLSGMVSSWYSSTRFRALLKVILYSLLLNFSCNGGSIQIIFGKREDFALSGRYSFCVAIKWLYCIIIQSRILAYNSDSP